jgi:hypothetical protein
VPSFRDSYQLRPAECYFSRLGTSAIDDLHGRSPRMAASSLFWCAISSKRLALELKCSSKRMYKDVTRGTEAGNTKPRPSLSATASGHKACSEPRLSSDTSHFLAVRQVKTQGNDSSALVESCTQFLRRCSLRNSGRLSQHDPTVFALKSVCGISVVSSTILRQIAKYTSITALKETRYYQ